jgi:prepilin-type N-terminal cleavage/methylation domain
MTQKKGFTLIELLVVVAIIGLLSTLSIVALNTARAKARDARRVSDVKQIQTALELYYNDNGEYPTSTNLAAALSPTYMGVVPTPPTPADGNCNAATAYEYTHTAGSYTLTYCLGAATGGIDKGVGTATPQGIVNK